MRGGCLSADRLVHLPGYGDFQVEAVSQVSTWVEETVADKQILAAPESSLASANRPHQRNGNMSLDAPADPLSSRTENADDLTATNDPDLMANEQTWPTEEDMAGAPGATSAGESGKKMKRVPKGTSAYQAAWIVDDDEEDDGDDDDDDDEDDEDMSGEDGEDGELERGVIGDDEETEEIELDSRKGEAHRDMDADEEERE